MACGLGAIVLVFMLVKHNVNSASQEVDPFRADLTRLEGEEGRLQKAIADTRQAAGDMDDQRTATAREIAVARTGIEQTTAEIARQKSRIAALKEAIDKSAPAQKSDVLERPRLGEETYIMGLKLEGARIAILVDSSASMTDEALIDVIRRKNTPDDNKKAGPKWKRTRKIVEWLLARLPEGSDVSVIAFADRASHLGGPAWKPGRDTAALATILADLDRLTPYGPTNLQAGLTAIAAQKPTHVYLITDGLPTAGDSSYKSLNPFANCSSLWGNSATISGDCRKALFTHTLKESALSPGVVVHVILLPIEGDPEAANAYWSWTSRTGGLLISPAESWP